MIVIDTFSRCSGGADENNASEIAKFLAAADALQQEFQCAVLIVHHEGKDGQRGPRGSSAFMGNTETVIGVASTSEGCQVTCSKQKDSKEFAPISLQMVAVRYGVNEEDESLVLTLGQEPAPSITFSAETTMYNVLLTAPERTLTYSKWVEAGMDKSLGSARIESKRTAEDAISTLKRSGRVHQEKKGAPYSIPLDAIPQQEVPPQEVPDIA